MGKAIEVEWKHLDYEMDGVPFQRIFYQSVRDCKRFYYQSVPGICYNEDVLNEIGYNDMLNLVNMRLGKLDVSKKHDPIIYQNAGILSDMSEEGGNEGCEANHK